MWTYTTDSMDFVTVSTGLIIPYWMGLPIRYIHEQEMHDIAMDKMSVKEYSNPFSEAAQQAYKQEKARRKNK